MACFGGIGVLGDVFSPFYIRHEFVFFTVVYDRRIYYPTLLEVRNDADPGLPLRWGVHVYVTSQVAKTQYFPIKYLVHSGLVHAFDFIST